MVLLLLLCGCALFQTYEPQPRGPTPEEWFNQRWAGKLEDEVIVQYGKPDEVLLLSTGNHVVSYRRSVVVASGRSSFSQYGGGSRSDATTIDCERRFEIHKDTAKVVRAVITGSRCDYSR